MFLSSLKSASFRTTSGINGFGGRLYAHFLSTSEESLLKNGTTVVNYDPEFKKLRKNWLEENCGQVPQKFKSRDDIMDSVFRSALLSRESSLKFVEAVNASTNTVEGADELLHNLKNNEKDLLDEIKGELHYQRARPSLAQPLLTCLSYSLGKAVSMLGNNISLQFMKGLKEMTSIHYNDCLRDVYEQSDRSVKNLLKKNRDQDLEVVDYLKTKSNPIPIISEISKNSTRAAINFSSRI